MIRTFTALALALAAVPAPALAQAGPVASAGTRLEISATGEVARIPDLAIISAGVVTRAPTATGAIQDNAARMERVRDALRRAGIADRDIQTSSISLNPDYRYQDNQPPVLTGYQASNSLSIRFRDLRSTGRILDALVAQGANQINGPTLTIDRPEAALDEARMKAIAAGRARAELYARTLGMRVARLVAVSETGGHPDRPPQPMMMAMERDASTKIEPGEQRLQVTLAMTFDLQ